MLALLPATLLSTALLLDGSVRAEGRDGATVAGQDPRAAAVALELNGRTSGPDASLLFGVLPSGVLSQENQLFARGYLEVDLRIGTSGALRMRQRGGYGSVDLSPIGLAAASAPGTPPPTTVQAPPAARFVRVQESNSSLELDLFATRRLRVLASAAWNVAGGANHEAVLSMPLSRGPEARAFLEWAATRLDTLRLEATGIDTRYSGSNRDTRVSIATLTAGWRTVPSRGAELSFAAGAGVGRASSSATFAGPPLPEQANTVPSAVGSAECKLTGMRDFSAVLGTGVEPVGDALSGDLVERASLRASAGWGRAGRVAVNARVTGSVALTSGSLDPNAIRSGDRFLQGELSLSIPVTRRSGVDLGARASWLSRPLQNQPARQWIAFLGYSAQVSLLP
jgi:hypothetical protein